MANDLTDVTAKVVAISGRKDLETRGLITGFVNEAQDFCHRNSFFSDEGEGKYSVDLAANAFLVQIPAARIIRDVWCTDSDGVRWELEKKEIGWIRKEYGEEIADPTSVTNGTPMYYAKAVSRALNSSAATYDTEDTDASADSQYTLIIMQPPSELVTITVYGDFKLTALSAGADTSWWTTNQINVLADATHMIIERRMGDKNKADALEEWVLKRLQILNFDNLEQSLEDAPISEG